MILPDSIYFVYIQYTKIPYNFFMATNKHFCTNHNMCNTMNNSSSMKCCNINILIFLCNIHIDIATHKILLNQTKKQDSCRR